MSGHLLEEPDEKDGLFDHSGLSYFTRAPSIQAVIDEARARDFVNATVHPFVFRTEQ